MLRRLLMHPRLIVRFVSLEGLALIAMYAGWSLGYLFLPEGVLRMKSGAALLAGSEPAASLWLEFARIAAINLAVVALFVLLPNRILSVNGYPLGYLPTLFWSAHYGALLGSNSFTYPMAQRLAPTLDVFGRSGVYEIAAYCLAAVSTHAMAVAASPRLFSFASEPVEPRPPLRQGIHRGGLAVALLLLLAACLWEAYRITVEIGPGLSAAGQ